jgi:hypothetical protein
MDGSQTRRQLYEKRADVIELMRAEGIVFSPVETDRGRGPLEVVDGRRYYEYSSYTPIYAISAISGNLPYTGPNTPPRPGPNPSTCRFGNPLGYRIASKWNDSQERYYLMEHITDPDQRVGGRVYSYSHEDVIKKSALFTDKEEMLCYTSYRVVKEMQEYNRNCMLSKENDDWLVSCNPGQGLRVTAKLHFADVEEREGRNAYHGLVCDYSVNDHEMQYTEFEQINSFFGIPIPAQFREPRSRYTAAVLGTVSHCDGWAHDIGEDMQNYLQNEILRRRFQGT